MWSTDMKDATVHEEGWFKGTLVQLSPGMYADEADETCLVVHLGEVIRSLSLDDTQECRATIYGAWAKFCDDADIDLVLVREPDVPSVRSPTE